MSPSDWIRLASDVGMAHFAVAGLLVAATAYNVISRRSGPLKTACAGFGISAMASYLAWQSCPISIMEDAMRHMADPSYSPTTSVVVGMVFPHYHPYWMNWPSYDLIILTAGNVVVCAYITVICYFRARANRIVAAGTREIDSPAIS